MPCPMKNCPGFQNCPLEKCVSGKCECESHECPIKKCPEFKKCPYLNKE